MKETFHIGERCYHGTAKIELINENSVTMALYTYKTKNKKVEETFYDTMALIMWLGEQMDSYNADKILDEIKKSNVSLRETSIW